MSEAVVGQVRRSAPIAGRTFYVIVAILVVLFGVKLVTSSMLELRTDEAYHWTWSKEWVLSYLDHPPMIAWFVRFGTSLFGDTLFGARFADLLAILGAELLLADIVRRRTGSLTTAALTMLAIESSIHVGAMGVLIEPSVPLILFCSLMFWSLCRLEETGNGRWWLLVGAAAGLALLSKYTSLLFVPAIVVFLVATPHGRRWLLTPWPWIAGLIAGAIFSPVLWWNVQNDWASVQYQSGRAVEAGAIELRHMLEFVVVHLGLVGPFLLPLIVVGCIFAAVRAFREGDGATLALVTAFLFFISFLLVRSLTLRINTSWPIAVWPFGIAAAVITFQRRAAGFLGRARATGKLLLIPAICVNIPLLLLMSWHATFDRTNWARADPLGRDDGYAEIAKAIEAMADTSEVKWVATTDYRTYAIMRWMLRGRLPVVHVTQRSRYIGFMEPSEVGQPGVYVYEKDRQNPAVPETALGAPVSVDRTWRGFTYNTFEIRPLRDWTPDLTPPKDSPLYSWPDLV
jgi:4-amino-4-deoxy-L-arabinose transferase-like glycosyltransferase